jgi:hypothetical protein
MRLPLARHSNFSTAIAASSNTRTVAYFQYCPTVIAAIWQYSAFSLFVVTVLGIGVFSNGSTS